MHPVKMRVEAVSSAHAERLYESSFSEHDIVRMDKMTGLFKIHVITEESNMTH